MAKRGSKAKGQPASGVRVRPQSGNPIDLISNALPASQNGLTAGWPKPPHDATEPADITARMSLDGRFVIKRLPAPPQKVRAHAYPFHELEVGECLLIERDLKHGPTSAAKVGRKLGRVFDCRKLEPPAVGWGVWRVK